jgi:type IX secretion system PorP/SprF family membrane protein
MKQLLAICIITCSVGLLAQNGPMTSHYFFNSQQLNPGWFNHKSPITAQASTRVQWLSYDNAPITHTFSGQYNYLKQHTFGLILLNDQIGNFNKLQASGTYAYRLDMGDFGQVAFGVRAGYSNQSTKTITGYVTDLEDPVLRARNAASYLSLGAGFYATSNDFFFGIAAPDLFNNSILPQTTFYNGIEGGMFNLTMGAKLVHTKQLLFYPSLILATTFNSPLFGSLDFNLLIQNGLWLTAGVTTNVGTTIGMGYLFDNGLRIMYSSGISIGRSTKHGLGIHEISIGYTKDLFNEPFSKRKYTNGKGFFASLKTQIRRRKRN